MSFLGEEVLFVSPFVPIHLLPIPVSSSALFSSEPTLSDIRQRNSSTVSVIVSNFRLRLCHVINKNRPNVDIPLMMIEWIRCQRNQDFAWLDIQTKLTWSFRLVGSSQSSGATSLQTFNSSDARQLGPGGDGRGRISPKPSAADPFQASRQLQGPGDVVVIAVASAIQTNMPRSIADMFAFTYFKALQKNVLATMDTWFEHDSFTNNTTAPPSASSKYSSIENRSSLISSKHLSHERADRSRSDGHAQSTPLEVPHSNDCGNARDRRSLTDGGGQYDTAWGAFNIFNEFERMTRLPRNYRCLKDDPLTEERADDDGTTKVSSSVADRTTRLRQKSILEKRDEAEWEDGVRRWEDSISDELNEPSVPEEGEDTVQFMKSATLSPSDVACEQRQSEAINVDPNVSQQAELARASATRSTGADDPTWTTLEPGTGVDVSPWFKIMPLENSDLFSTYPLEIISPQRASKALIERVAQYRHNGRIPSISWIHLETGASLSRAAQPSAGSYLSGSADELYCSLLNQSLHPSTADISLRQNMAKSLTNLDNLDATGKATAVGDELNDCSDRMSRQTSLIHAPDAMDGRTGTAHADPTKGFAGPSPQSSRIAVSPTSAAAPTKNGKEKMRGSPLPVETASPRGGMNNAVLAASMDALEGRRLHIIDCRTRTAAAANFTTGGGYEIVSNYDRADIQFMQLDNIHGVRAAFNKLGKLCSTMQRIDNDCPQGQKHPAGQFWSKLDNTGWPEMTMKLIWASWRATELLLVGSSVLVHCTDGWDRTAQVCSLAMIQLDAHYRTVEGFCILIAREWLEMGYRFADRCAHDRAGDCDVPIGVGVDELNDAMSTGVFVPPSTSEKGALGGGGTSPSASQAFNGLGYTNFTEGGTNPASQVSPVFVQFIDAVYQLLRMHPSDFEFTPRFLQYIVDQVYSCRFGTFLCNFHRSRCRVNGLVTCCASVWGEVEEMYRFEQRHPEAVSANEKIINPFYIPPETYLEQQDESHSTPSSYIGRGAGAGGNGQKSTTPYQDRRKPTLSFAESGQRRSNGIEAAGGKRSKYLVRRLVPSFHSSRYQFWRSQYCRYDFDTTTGVIGLEPDNLTPFMDSWLTLLRRNPDAYRPAKRVRQNRAANQIKHCKSTDGGCTGGSASARKQKDATQHQSNALGSDTTGGHPASVAEPQEEEPEDDMDEPFHDTSRLRTLFLSRTPLGHLAREFTWTNGNNAISPAIDESVSYSGADGPDNLVASPRASSEGSALSTANTRSNVVGQIPHGLASRTQVSLQESSARFAHVETAGIVCTGTVSSGSSGYGDRERSPITSFSGLRNATVAAAGGTPSTFRSSDEHTFIPRSDANACEICAESFTFFFRRHTCRCCCRSVCSKCGGRFLKLPPYLIALFEEREVSGPVRVCTICYSKAAQVIRAESLTGGGVA